jgi:hypothetical protein
VLISNDEVGHGVDHAEISVLYEWNSERNGQPTRGGATGKIY